MSDQAAWDGEGRDPWLPARLQALLDAAEAEELIYEQIWNLLSSWLVITTRRILRDSRIDVTAIHALTPLWEKGILGIVNKAIIPVMSRAYRAIFGEGYDWQDRPNVLEYLAQVRNRLVRVPDHVFDLVSGHIAAGVTLGEGIPELAERIQEVLSTTATERWPNRAVVIARTETLGALNASRADAFQAFEEEEGEGMERIWLATKDSRTRPSHREADGQRRGVREPFTVGGTFLNFPGDPNGLAQEVIQCRCTTLLVEIGENVNMSNRQLKRRVTNA